MRSSRSRLAVALAGTVVAVLGLSACSSSSSGGSSASPAGAAPACTEASIKAAIAPDDTVTKWACGDVAGGKVAAVAVATQNGYNFTVWLKSGATQWYPADGKALCTETLPGDLNGFCGSTPSPTSSPSGSSTKPASICTQDQVDKVIAQVEKGAKYTIEGFQCASGANTELLAVKVKQGELIVPYFFQNEGGQWVLVNNSVCKDPVAATDPVFQKYCS